MQHDGVTYVQTNVTFVIYADYGVTYLTGTPADEASVRATFYPFRVDVRT